MAVKHAIVIVDDHAAFAEAVGLTLSLTDDLVCVATSDGSKSMVELHETYKPVLFVSDFQLGAQADGLTAARGLRQAGIKTPVILLTGWPTPFVVSEAGGIADLHVVPKSTSMREVVRLMRLAIAGQPLGITAPDYQDLKLSGREMAVLDLLGKGERANDIAEHLSLSVHTVRDHIKEILKKLNADSQLKAVLNAQRLGLLSVSSEVPATEATQPHSD